MMFFSIRRRVVFFVAAFSLAAITVTNLDICRANAQSAPPPQMGQQPAPPPIVGVNDPANPMHLTPTQQKAFIAIKMQFFKDRTAIMQNTSIPGGEKPAKIEALEIASTGKMKALLNSSQLTLANRVEAQQKHISLLKTQGQALVTKLDSTVTPGQKAKINQIKANANSQYSAIMSSTASDQDKEQEIGALRQQLDSQTSAVLNLPSQQGIIDQLKQLQIEVETAEQKLQSSAQ